jgi:5-formyltetrahydrofolate cyclo-ligase
MNASNRPTGMSEAKAALRTQIRGLLGQLPAAERASASRALCERLAGLEVWQKAAGVLFYAPLPQEPDVWPLLVSALTTGKTIALPRYLPEQRDYAAARIGDPERDVQAGYFGIREPAAWCAEITFNRLDLVLVPGLAFDLQGRRLGRGRGYYDRLLTQVRSVTCGVAFDVQIVPEVPAGAQDVRLHCVVTPTRWVIP